MRDAETLEPHVPVGRLLPRHYISISMGESTMKRTTAFVAAIVFCTVGSVYAFWSGGPGGTWPKSWPKELEPLRKQASTCVGGIALHTRYEIPFTNRKEFESAWPHILKVKSKGAPITLLRGSHGIIGAPKTAGVCIQFLGTSPDETGALPVTTRTAATELPSVSGSAGPTRAATNEKPTPSPERRDNTPALTGRSVPVPPPAAATLSKTDSAGRLPGTPIEIWLVVDGDIVDLNRIPLPPDTPITDRRFEDGQNKSLNRSGG